MVKGTFFRCHYPEKEILFINLSSCLNTRKRHEHTSVSWNSTRPHFSYASCPILLNCSYDPAAPLGTSGVTERPPRAFSSFGLLRISLVFYLFVVLRRSSLGPLAPPTPSTSAPHHLKHKADRRPLGRPPALSLSPSNPATSALFPWWLILVVNLTHLGDRTSTEDGPPWDWLVGMFAGHFVDC